MSCRRPILERLFQILDDALPGLVLVALILALMVWADVIIKRG